MEGAILAAMALVLLALAVLIFVGGRALRAGRGGGAARPGPGRRWRCWCR